MLINLIISSVETEHRLNRISLLPLSINTPAMRSLIELREFTPHHRNRIETSIAQAKDLKKLGSSTDPIEFVRSLEISLSSSTLLQATYDTILDAVSERSIESAILQNAGSDIIREHIYSTTLSAWANAGGKLKTGGKTTAAPGNLPEYFLAVVGPLLESHCPDPLELTPIVAREKLRRAMS